MASKNKYFALLVAWPLAWHARQWAGLLVQLVFLLVAGSRFGLARRHARLGFAFFQRNERVVLFMGQKFATARNVS
jgi:hypothetical protein